MGPELGSGPSASDGVPAKSKAFQAQDFQELLQPGAGTCGRETDEGLERLQAEEAAETQVGDPRGVHCHAVSDSFLRFREDHGPCASVAHHMLGEQTENLAAPKTAMEAQGEGGCQAWKVEAEC